MQSPIFLPEIHYSLIVKACKTAGIDSSEQIQPGCHKGNRFFVLYRDKSYFPTAISHLCETIRDVFKIRRTYDVAFEIYAGKNAATGGLSLPRLGPLYSKILRIVYGESRHTVFHQGGNFFNIYAKDRLVLLGSHDSRYNVLPSFRFEAMHIVVSIGVLI